jgi:thiamine kinase-like enzyme
MNISVIKNGLDSKIFLLDDTQKYVLRIPKSTNATTSWSQTSYLAKLCHMYGVYDTFVFSDDETGIMVSTYVEGAKSISFTDYNELDQLLQILNRMHLIPFDQNRVSPFDMISYLSINNQTLSPFISRRFGEHLDIYYKALDYIAKVILPKKFSICHFDCHEGNVLVDMFARVHLIDFEQLKIFDPLYDLASIAVNAKLNNTRRLVLLEMYFGRKPFNSELIRLNIMCMMVCLYEIQWAIAKTIDGVEAEPYIKDLIMFLISNFSTELL